MMYRFQTLHSNSTCAATAGVLKLYLSSLPEPLLSYRLYDPLLAVAAVPTQSRRILALASLLVGWCRLTVSKPVLEVPMISALETVM